MLDILDDDICWPEGFMDIGDRTFAWVYDNRKEFVEFTLGMSKTTGLFKSWFQYCQRKL